MDKASVVLTVLLMVWSASLYSFHTWRGRVQPRFATWALLEVVVLLSCWMYWHSKNPSLTGNIGLVAATGNITTIFIVVIIARLRDKSTRFFELERVQKVCFALAACVFVFWTLTEKPLIAYILVQAIAIIAYAATVAKLRHAEQSSESLLFWVLVVVSGLASVYPTWVKNDVFGWVYLARGVPSSLYVVYLITRIQARAVSKVNAF